ncbi:chloroperoxidase-like protein [Cytidiella melzeri]|nr:chloroperoxidase-like protein [Cytidiella melzeri]
MPSDAVVVGYGLARLVTGSFDTLLSLLTNLGVLIWDMSLAVYNIAAPNRPSNRVVPAGFAGANGSWPTYVPPKDGDSRCSCPALNAMANHGILPHNGRGITFKELNTTIRTTYNFSPSFCFFVPNYAAQMLSRSYWTDKFDLSDLDVHNGIEHDASLTREDVRVQPDQGKPCVRLVEELLESGTGPDGDLTHADLARISGKRRAESKAANGQFSLSLFHKLFGSSNSSTLLTILGGRKEDLRPFLIEERLPDGWQPRILHPMGLTLAEFNSTVFRVEFGIKEELPQSLQAKKSKKQA